MSKTIGIALGAVMLVGGLLALPTSAGATTHGPASAIGATTAAGRLPYNLEGTVVDTSGAALEGVAVTIYFHYYPYDGPWSVLPNGSLTMGAFNRSNPSITAADGKFAWDMGFLQYKLRASRPGCVDPDDASVPYVETAPLDMFGNSFLGLELVLSCRAMPLVSIGDATMTEGNGGDRHLGFALTLSEPATDAVTVSYYVADRVTGSGYDFKGRTASVTIPAGSLGTKLIVPILGDTLPEATESFRVRITDVSGPAVRHRYLGTGTIIDDDTVATGVTGPTTPVRVDLGDASVVEGDQRIRKVFLTVGLSEPATGPVSVAWVTLPGSAQGGVDFIATSGTVNFAAGQRFKSIAIDVRPDLRSEADETFSVALDPPSGNAVLGDGLGTATILDDDAAS